MKIAYIDSSVWIVENEGLEPYKEIVDKSLTQLDNDHWSFALSELVVLEVLLKPKRQMNHALIESYNHAFSNAILFPTFDKVFQDALNLSQTENLKAIDAIHVAFAIQYTCELFVTSDPHFQNLKSLPLHIIDLSQIALK